MLSFRLRRILLVCFLSTCGLLVSAQVQFGIKAGYNLANIPGPQPEEMSQNNLSGFNAGIMTALSLKNNFSLQSEIVYSQQGTRLTIHNGNENDHYTFLYNYLN